MKVLLVDDNELNLKVTSRILEKFNIDSEMVTSGQACLDKIREDNSFDLIFMDIMMPDMDGVETFEKLKEMENFNSKVIVLTADADRGSEEKYMSKGFHGYLAKPIKIEELKKYLNL